MAVLVREISPSKTESDLIPTDPEMEVAIELLDSQVFSGSVDRGSDRWRFLGSSHLYTWIFQEVLNGCTRGAGKHHPLGFPISTLWKMLVVIPLLGLNFKA